MSNLVHVVYTTPMPVDRLGQVVVKQMATLDTLCTTSSELRVVADTTVPNSLNNPTIAQYLQLEATGGFQLGHMDQYLIVTYHS